MDAQDQLLKGTPDPGSFRPIPPPPDGSGIAPARNHLNAIPPPPDGSGIRQGDSGVQADAVRSNETQITEPWYTPTGMGQRAGSLLEGVAEAGISTVAGLDDIVAKIPHIGEALTTPIGQKIGHTLESEITGRTNSEKSRYRMHELAGDHNTPGSSNIYNKIGYGGETLGEFMLGDEALKGLSLAKRYGVVARTMKILEGSPRLMQALKYGAAASKGAAELTAEEAALVSQHPALMNKLAAMGFKITGAIGRGAVSDLAQEAARAGTVQAAQTLVRSGGDAREAAKAGLEGALVTGAVGGTLRGASRVARKIGKAGKTASELAQMAASAPEKQTIAENIQGTLHKAEYDLHTNYEEQTQNFKDRLEGAAVNPKEVPIAQKAEEILQKPYPEDHSSVQHLKGIRGDKLDPEVREFLENTASGKKALTDENVEAASQANKSKPKLVGADGKVLETPEIMPTAEDQEPHNADTLIKWRQQVRALASEFEPGDVNARALKRLLYDSADGSSAFDETFEQLAQQSGDDSVVQEYKALRDDYRTKIGKYDNPVIKNLMAGKPDDAAKAFIGTKNASGLPSAGRTEFNTDTLRELIGQQSLDEFSKDVFTNLMKESSDKNGFNAARFIDTWKRIGDGTKKGFFNIDNPDKVVKGLANDAKSVANVQKLVRAGLLAGGGKIAAAHPVGTGVATAIAFIAGHNGGGGGIEKGRELLDYIANHPNTWAAFRKIGNAAQSDGAAKAGALLKGGAKAGSALFNDSDTAEARRSAYDAAQKALGGN